MQREIRRDVDDDSAALALLPHMLVRGSGRIVNVSSVAATLSSPGESAYSASKAALIQMTRSIATSHARCGVRCNAVLPGLTGSEAALEHLPARLREIVQEETLTPYLGAPADIANVVAFLASDDARYITGQCIVADGGTSIHVPGYARLREFFAGSDRERS